MSPEPRHRRRQQIFETRAGHSGPDGSFVPAPGGSLIQARSINTKIQERVPDGARIAFSNNSGQLSVMGSDGGQNGTMPLPSPLTTCRWPTWSPDGTKIAFTSHRTGSYQIFTMNVDGTNQINISNSSPQDGYPAYSPDGTKI